MKKQLALLAALAIACGAPVGMTSLPSTGFTASAQANKVSGVIRDAQGEPLIGATVKVKGTNRGTSTDVDGKYSINANRGDVLVVSYIGSKPMEITVGSGNMDIEMQANDQVLDEVVVTALGIRKDKKSLGYAVDDLKAEELMRNKSANAINSLSGKIAGVNITQSSGAAGSGAQIILRGGTTVSETHDSQPLFVVDGVIYDNSAGIVGNSAFDGMMNSATTSSNRVMDINPEDIENMSILKGPAASALYGSRAANGVVIITTKKGKEGHSEVSFSGKMIASMVKDLPKTQHEYVRGYMTDMYNDAGAWTGLDIKDDSYNSWGPKQNVPFYDNLKNFFETGLIWDTNVSVSGGTKYNNFFLSGSFYDQDGIVPTTGYKKTTFRFNGEQKVGRFTFGANAAYSDARTTKTLTGAALYGSSGTGALYAAYNWAPSDDMRHYLNEDGTRYRMFGEQFDPWDERDNPYWIVNKNKMTDDTERFTGNFNVKWDLFDWWWLSYRMGVDSYTTQSENRIAPGGAIKKVWQNGMWSNNMYKYRYLSNNLMSNWNEQFGDFNVNLMLGGSTDYIKTRSDYEMAWNFPTELYSAENAEKTAQSFKHRISQKRMVSAFGEFRIDWRNAIFLTVTGRNDWTSTLPKDNRSYFYPSVSGAIAFTELFRESLPDWFSFGKIRASWAEVGKDTSPYETNTYLWPVGTYLGGKVGMGNIWSRGNSYMKPERTRSTEVGLELRFLQNRLKFDAAYYTNNSYDMILSPRGPQSTGYIFCSLNSGNIYNKGVELSLSGTPIQRENFVWETGINIFGNRGTVGELVNGIDVMYLTDVQYGGAKAASYNHGVFMGIDGTKWNRNSDGKLILDKNGFPTTDGKAYEVGDREAKWQGGWNNTFTFFKNWTFNMLWEFRYGGDVFNGTKYAMSMSGTSQLSADWRNQPLTIEGVVDTGQKDADGNPIYQDVSNTWKANENYMFNNVETSGYNIIKNYYTGAYNYEVRNWITYVKSLRLRTISLTYDVPRSFLARTKYIKRAAITASANNLLLFTNYDGDPEVAASGAGIGGSSSVGFDYCGVPATRQYALGVNLVFGTDNEEAPARVNNVELDLLNGQINDLRNQLANANNASNARIAQVENDLAAANKALANCRNDLNAAKNKPATVVDNSKQYMNVLVHFPVNKTAVTTDQRPNVERVATYLKSHPEATCTIKGYASPEGNQENNIKLANGRAASVKDLLVKKYGIAANRINAAGQGISNMFDELSWNRVSICEIIVK